MMSLNDVVALVGLLEANSIPVWLDGGWGVDALVGTQTRPHDDLDIVVEQRHLPRLRGVLATWGFREVEGGSSWNFVLVDRHAREIDVHVVRFDAAGNGLYGPDGLMYPAGSLGANGALGGLPLRCKSAQQQMADRAGYEWSASDQHDVRTLHDKLGVEIPSAYTAKLELRLPPAGVTTLGRRRGRVARRRLLLVALVLLGCSSPYYTTVKRSGEPAMTYVPGEDSTMSAAIEKARSSLSTFETALASPPPGASGFTVKVAFAVGSAVAEEHIWLSQPVFAGDQVSGIVGNTSVHATYLSLGQRVTVPRSDVSDWMYVERGLLKGGFTFRVLLDRLSRADRAATLAEMGVRFDDADPTLVDTYLECWDQFAQGANALIIYLDANEAAFESTLAAQLNRGDPRSAGRFVFYTTVQVMGSVRADSELGRAWTAFTDSSCAIFRSSDRDPVYSAPDVYLWWVSRREHFPSYALFEEWSKREFAVHRVIPMYNRIGKPVK